jgi:N-acetylmuramoyl-L-alanine amidase
VGNGLQEKDINLEISRRLAKVLSGYQVEVALTRNSDVYLGLAQRCALANNLGARYFCSIHVNGGGGTGFESYTYTGAKEETENLRNAVHSKVAAYFQNAGFVDRGKKKADFYVLRETIMPAVLLENLFIDHGMDSLRLKSASFLDGLAEAIAGGLAAALGLQPKAGPVSEPGSTLVKTTATVSAAQARGFLAAKNPQAPDYIQFYIALEAKYGIRWDAVFAQSCLETGFWKYGGLVKPEQNNFAGLGAFDGKGGAYFATPAEGIEAQFQHWHVYYYGGNLPSGTKVLDPRRDAVLKSGWAGKLHFVEDLGGRWAPAGDYGSIIVSNYLMKMQALEVQVPAKPTPKPWDPAAEIASLKADGLIDSGHRPEDPVYWGEMATVLNRLRGQNSK